MIPGESADAIADVSAATDAPGQSLRSLGLRKLLATLPLAIASFSVFWGAVTSVLLPIQVQTIDPKGQVNSLALVIGVGAFASMIAAPIAGALTDRTRTRLGGREPWMIAGALSSLALASGMGFVTSIPLLMLMMVALQFTTNFILTPVSAYIPDRVPVSMRGMFSSAYGVAQLLGSVIGASLGAGFANLVPAGYIVGAGLLAVLVVLFALVNARSNLHETRTPITFRTLLATFWVNPVAHPDFAWAFLGRFLLFTGFYPVQTFSLYILQDYIGLGADAVAAIPVTSAAGLVGMLLGSGLGGLLAQRIGRTKPLIYAASAVIVIALTLPLVWPSLTALIIYSALSGLGAGAYISVDLVLITLVLPSASDAGKDLGIINITTTLPQTIGAAIGGAAVAVFGGYVGLFPIAMAATVLGAVMLAFIRGAK